jgi:hypothetical protein
LLGLGRLATFISVTTKEGKVYLVFQCVVYHLVKGVQEVLEAGGQPGFGVDTPVAFNTKVKVGKVEDFQPLPL